MQGRIGWRRALGAACASALVVMGLAGAGPAWAGWRPAGTVASGSVGSAHIAVARDGTAYVVYTGPSGGNTRVFVIARPPGGSFGAPRPLSAAGQNSTSPSIAVDRQGNVVAAWDDLSNST